MSASARSTPSPLQAASPAPPDDFEMPKGHCRYILLLPEVKGQRCACVNFTHNKSIPSATCGCGHLACFHKREPEPPVEMKHEMDLLKSRIQLLEEQLTKGHDRVLDTLGSRLSEVEEQVEKSRDEVKDEFKRTYQNISLTWRSIDQVQARHRQYDAQFKEVDARLLTHNAELNRLDERAMELADADASLEERLDDALAEMEPEGEERPSGHHNGNRRPRRRSTSDTTPRPSHPLGVPGPLGPLGPSSGPPLVDSAASQGHRPLVNHPLIQGLGASNAFAVPTLMSFRAIRAPSPPKGPWTVHVSLLPKADVAMPFERNTTAYLRCLSRGLHRMVAIPGPDAASSNAAVSRAFQSHLRGRDWMPLQAKLCDAEQLQGLPMLRQLDPQPPLSACDAEFLRKNCAVCDANGMMDSLYIAMKKNTLTWQDMKEAPVFIEDLEESWKYDKLLDAVPSDVDTVVAGDIVAISSSLKRSAHEMSRNNNGEAASVPGADADGYMAKRPCPPPPNSISKVRPRGVETV